MTKYGDTILPVHDKYTRGWFAVRVLYCTSTGRSVNVRWTADRRRLSYRPGVDTRGFRSVWRSRSLHGTHTHTYTQARFHDLPNPPDPYDRPIPGHPSTCRQGLAGPGRAWQGLAGPGRSRVHSADRRRAVDGHAAPTPSAGTVSRVENLKKSLCALAPVVGCIISGCTAELCPPGPGAGANVRNFGFAGSTRRRQ